LGLLPFLEVFVGKFKKKSWGKLQN